MKLEKSWLCIACFPDTAQPKEGFPLAAKVISVSCEATGSAWGGQRPVWGADRPGEDREEDHAASADPAAVWTLLRAAPGGHRLAGQGPMALWRVFIILKSPALWLQTLEVTDVLFFFIGCEVLKDLRAHVSAVQLGPRHQVNETLQKTNRRR